MEKKHLLSLDEMEQITGGAFKQVSGKGGTVRQGPGQDYAITARLSGGCQVNFTGTVSFNEPESASYYKISSPVRGWILENEFFN